jgi:hypothetical protein
LTAGACDFSANPRRFWDLGHARELLGSHPQDAAPV